MSELELVMNALIQTKKLDLKSALATVVRVVGSAYRREGAKMLIDEEGNRSGMISGGCLENDVAEVAKIVIDSGIPILKTYNLDEDLVWGLGLGCPGRVDIYIEPMHVHSALELTPFGEWTNSFVNKKESILATIMEASIETKRIFYSREKSCGDLGDRELNIFVQNLANDKLNETNPKAETITTLDSSGKEVQVFLDVYLPPVELMIFGAGHDALPVVNFAATSGFDTTVVDQREAYNSIERFPNSKRLVLNPSQFENEPEISHRTYVVVMNHHLERDQETLKFILNSPAPYIGVLGPRSRMKRMMKVLEEEGVFMKERDHERLHNPIGLDIGAVSSEEIAISILAEVIAKKNGYQGGFLKGKDAIHHKNIYKDLKFV